MFNPGHRSAFVLAAVIAACAPAAPPPPPAPMLPPPPPRPEAPVNPNLPAIPLATGALQINVVYPRAGELVASRDSAFIFGSLGNGNAFLTINGVAAPVWPNGAFLTFLPVPPADRPAYELVAFVGADTVRVMHPVRLPPPVDPSTAVTTVQPVPATQPPDTLAGRFGVITHNDPADTARVLWGTPVSDQPVRFFFLPGTLVRVLGQSGDRVRVALDASQEVTLPARDVSIQSPGSSATVRLAAPPRIVPGNGSIDVAIATQSPPPYLFISDSTVLRLTLYSTTSATRGDTLGAPHVIPVDDTLLASVEHSYSANRASYAFNLKRRVYGYRMVWDQGQLVIQIRRPPQVDATSPLRGLTIGVDPGHPGLPGESPGATGPTGLREPDAVLAVGQRVRELLEQRGATVVMTRSGAEPVPLNVRPALAVRADAHAFVSIHLDAVPDNVNPMRYHGSHTYYWHGHSRRLAETTQRALLQNMFLRDLGVMRENFAVLRHGWMPSILTEGAFIILPDQEYALRTPEYQDAYARAIVQGLEAFFAELAAGW